MTLSEALRMIDELRAGETFEEYKKRMRKLRRYSEERYDLIDALEILTEPEDEERAAKKRARLETVERRIRELS